MRVNRVQGDGLAASGWAKTFAFAPKRLGAPSAHNERTRLKRRDGDHNICIYTYLPYDILQSVDRSRRVHACWRLLVRILFIHSRYDVLRAARRVIGRCALEIDKSEDIDS